jgi:8-oxo-dGTP pyrophosphatase MutT (NUDIX family)
MAAYLGNLFSQLAFLLPPMLAEDDVGQDVDRNTLASRLDNIASQVEVQTALATVERLFCALALIHLDSSTRGIWRFQSYAAWLVARSLLETLANDQHTIVDPGYWGAQPSDGDMDEQRALLRRLETGRLRHHPTQEAKPIRFVYVAWAVLRVGEQFLLYAREDKRRADAQGHFGFPGGRFKLSDAPLAARPPRAEHDFAYGITHWPMQHLQRSLFRELQEELGLSEQDHYTFGDAIDVPPYCRVEGARNHHAYTEYRIRLYPLRLNTRGAVRLFERLQLYPDAFAWFTLDELGAERNLQGQRAFVTALVEHFGTKMETLAALPPAIDEPYLLSTPLVGVDIPLVLGRDVTLGRSGKPMKPHAVQLTKTEHGWLWALAWHAKSLPFAGREDVDGLLPHGWVRIHDLPAVQGLRKKLEASGLRLVQILDDQYVRLSIDPRHIYFAPEFFSYQLHGDVSTCRLELFCSTLETPLGMVQHEPVSVGLNMTLAAELRHVSGVEHLPDTTPRTDNLRRMLDEALGSQAKNLGLRQLIVGLAYERKHWKFTICKRES